MNYDLIVIGSGPGGYVTAIRASQLGLKTAIVEKESLGGICLNWGCIPTKALLKSAQVFEYINKASTYGIKVNGSNLDFVEVIKRSRDIANGMSKGIEYLMKKNKIDTNLSLKNILIIGIFQILAVIPGVSRSGIIITASRFLNFDRVDSSKISFYLSIPALAGASILSLKDVMNANIDLNILFLYSIIFSFIVSYLTIKYFLIYVKNFNLNIL